MSATLLFYSSACLHCSYRCSYHHCGRFRGKCQAVWTHIFAVIQALTLCLTAVWIYGCSFVDIHEILWYSFQRIQSYRRILYPYNWRLFSFRLISSRSRIIEKYCFNLLVLFGNRIAPLFVFIRFCLIYFISRLYTIFYILSIYLCCCILNNIIKFLLKETFFFSRLFTYQLR